VQVAPIKPTLKPTGTKRLKLNYDILFSTSAFKFNLRRYTKDAAHTVNTLQYAAPLRVAVGKSQAGAYTRSLFSST